MTPALLTLAALQCLHASDMTAALADQHQEVQVATMMDDRGVMLVIYASASGSWTAVTVDGNLTACIIAGGQRFAMIAPGELP